jgi:hypothetical protein
MKMNGYHLIMSEGHHVLLCQMVTMPYKVRLSPILVRLSTCLIMSDGHHVLLCQMVTMSNKDRLSPCLILSDGRHVL